MVTVKVDPVRVEYRLAAGEVSCPSCADEKLAGSGFARSRPVVGMVGPVRPRRSRCRSCLVTHVLLPVTLRRAYLADGDAAPLGRAEAVARITWCVDQHVIEVITGEVGAGKTVAIRAATAALDPARHVIIYLPNPSVGVRGMFHHIVTALGRVPNFYTAPLAPQAAEALAAEHAERGRTPVVVIDEAHLLDNAQMEAIRMLTNHDMDSGSPFAALLVGQPTLRHRLRLGVLAALDQRIAVRYAIGRDDTRRQHRLHQSSLQDRWPHGPIVLR